MGTAKVSSNFSSNMYTDTEFGTKSTDIVNKMTGNVNFTDPTPALAEITTAISSYQTALAKAENGSKNDRVIKNSWRAKLQDQLKELSLYVQLTSKGDEVIISSSGFDINKKPGTVGPLYKPEGVTVTMGNNMGTVYVSCDAIERASFYEVQYAEVIADGIQNWILKTSTKRKLLIEGLTSGKKYVFRIAGAGADPSRVWSDQITTFVV